MKSIKERINKINQRERQKKKKIGCNKYVNNNRSNNKLTKFIMKVESQVNLDTDNDIKIVIK